MPPDNVGGGLARSLSLLELRQHCQTITGKQIPLTSIPKTRVAESPYYVSDCRKITKAESWYPQYSILDILQEATPWIEKPQTQLKPMLG